MDIIAESLKNGIVDFGKAREDFAKNPQGFAEFVMDIQKALNRIGVAVIADALESRDQWIRESPARKDRYDIVRKDRKQLITSLGTVSFEKTLFRDKTTGQSAYLLDRLLGMESHQRMTEDAVTNILTEAVQTSYRKAGDETCCNEEQVSKETVMEVLHSLEFPEEQAVHEKKQVEHLYIDADEDHISLQFREKKGDLAAGENGYKNNTVLGKLVYVYEGIERDAPRSIRHRLINPHYFSGVYSGEDNDTLWKEVWKYIENHYDIDHLKKIYVNGDGAAWIKASKKHLYHCVQVLDEFHLEKYLVKMTSHMKDSQLDSIQELKKIIKDGSKAEFRECSKRIKECTEERNRLSRIEECETYVLSNWGAAKLRLVERKDIRGCSAEGHVSHVLSARMSSRPMGWSRRGADRMCRLRAYDLNKGDMLELVRYQKKWTLKKAAGAEEEEILSAHQVLLSERNRNGELGKYMDILHVDISLQTRERIYFRNHFRL